MNKLLQAGLFSVVALLSGYAGFQVFQGQQPTTPNPTPDNALAFSLPDLTGQTRSLKDWPDKILVVNFWATWCPPCKAEIPDFIDLQKQYAAQGVQFVGIATSDETARVKAFHDQVGMNYPVLLADAQNGRISKQLGNQFGGLPFTVVIDQQGKIRTTVLGEWVKSEAITLLDQLLIDNQSHKNRKSR